MPPCCSRYCNQIVPDNVVPLYGGLCVTCDLLLWVASFDREAESDDAADMDDSVD